MAGYQTKEEMAAVIERFIQKMTTDEALSKRCKGINVTMGYDIPDVGLSFYTNFNDGAVTGGLGESDPPSMVFLEMDSEIFDGMLTGEVDAASAAMNGSLSFSGYMSAALGLQALNDDMSRIYIAAKQE
jgi:putative sterol carrier protein